MLDDKLFKRNDYESTKFTNSSSKNEPLGNHKQLLLSMVV